MFRAAFPRAVVVAAICIETLLVVRFTQARSKPLVETNAANVHASDPSDPALSEPSGAELVGDGPNLLGTRVTAPQLETVAPVPVKPVPMRVLMVGNSYTLHHSLHLLLKQVAAAVTGGPHLEVDAVARGGYSLRLHLRTGEALRRIRAGRYTHVVLQGHSLSALDHPRELAVDAERFKQAIDAADSRTVFYATWARSPEVSLYRTHRSVHSFADMSARVSSTYFALSTRLGAGLAPVGMAFERSLVEHPKLTLWGADGSHPSLAGSYMAACVLYGAITGVDPSLTHYVPPGMNASDAERVRAVAAESLASTKLVTPPAAVGSTLGASLHGPT